MPWARLHSRPVALAMGPTPSGSAFQPCAKVVKVFPFAEGPSQTLEFSLRTTMGPRQSEPPLPWYPCVANSARAFFSPPYSRALSPSILSPLSARCALADCCNVLLASSCCCCCTRSAARRSSPPACLVHSYFCPHYCPPPMIPSFASPAHSLTHRSSSFTHRYSSLLIAHFLLVTASPLLVAASYALTQ